MHDDDLIGGLRALGIPAEAIDRAMRRGDPEGAIFDAVLMPAIADRTVSASEIERRGGLRVSEVQAFISAFGLRPPRTGRFGLTRGSRAHRDRGRRARIAACAGRRS